MTNKSKNPFSAFANIQREELPLALLMFGYFFLVITTFWILKPIKKSLFIQFYDERTFSLFGTELNAAQSELVAKVLNMVVAYVAVVVFTWLARRFARQQLTYAFSGFFLITYVLYALVLDSPAGWTVWSFYLYGDLYSTLMVATFFAFLNDAVVPATARRIYGLVVFGGVLGGVFGTMAVKSFISELSPSTWLWVCLAIALGIVVLARAAGSRVSASPDSPKQEPEGADEAKESGGNPALEGAKLVFQSRYLLSIVTIVGVYEIVSTIIDFQFTSTISHYLDGDAIGEQFSQVFLITNITSMLVQLFVTGFVMSRFKLTVALMILPVAALAGSAAFMLIPALWIGSLLNTADNGFAYSVNQSAKEALYTPTTREEKYKAKAFIDMFVQRFAKALAVGVSLAITTVFTDFSSIRWLSLVTVVLVVLWVGAARFAGRRFHELSG